VFWELAIKISIGKYKLNEPFESFLDRGIIQNGFLILPCELQTPPTLVEQSPEFFEPVRFETRPFGASGQFRCEAQSQKLRRADRPLQIVRQHRFQPLRLEGLDQRALVF